MFFRSFFDEKLAHMSYLVGCQRTGEAIVVDPGRNLAPYFETAAKEGLRIVAATETHIHADFLSGVRELGVTHGAKLYLSDEGDENWKYQYTQGVDFQFVNEGSRFTVGNLDFDVLHTPGHTPESISFVLTDRGGGSKVPMGIFTGDFVFVGDIGRPDLLEKAAGVVGTADSGARQMFTSLQKFKALAPYLQVWPAHGAGSACGKALGAVPSTTVGYELENNWAMKINEEEAFVTALLTGQPEAPFYFKEMKKLNKVGPNLVPTTAVHEYTTVEQVKESDALIIDTRSVEAYSSAHLQGSINIPFNKSFVTWVGWLVNYEEDVVVIADAADVADIRSAMQSIGLDRLVAFAAPSVIANETASYEHVTVHDIVDRDDFFLLDVRGYAEWDEGHLQGATHMMLGQLRKRLDELPRDREIVVQCRSGARSAIGVSLLVANGFQNVKNLTGGYLAWTKEKFPVVQ